MMEWDLVVTGSLGTSLSRSHRGEFTAENSIIMHNLFSIVDYLLLQPRVEDPELTLRRQNVLCEASFVELCFSIVMTNDRK